MSRAGAAINPGQTNKRFIMLAVVLGLIGAVMLYVAVSREGGAGGSGSGDVVPVVVAKADIPARTKIGNSMIEVKLVPTGDRGSLAYVETTEVVGKTTRFPIAAGEQVLSNKIVPLEGTGSVAGKSLSYVIPPGKRAMSITVSEVVVAGGLILPGDYVDILVVYDVEFFFGRDRETFENFIVQTLMQSIEVLAVSQTVVDVVPEQTVTNADGTITTTATGQRERITEANAQPTAVTVTLALTPDQLQKLYLAEANGRVRLAVRPFGESQEQPIEPMTSPDLFPRNLPNPFTR